MSNPPTKKKLQKRIQELEEETSSLKLKVQTSEKCLNLTLNAVSDGLWDWNARTGEVYRSPGWFSMLGYEPDELPGTVSTWKQILHPKDRDRVMALFRAHLNRETPDFQCEYRCRRKTGEWKWILDRARVVERDEEGKPLRMFGAQTDIHNRKLAEKALRQAHHSLEEHIKERTADLAAVSMQMEALINTIPDVAYFKDIEGRNLLVNKGFEKLSGLKCGDIIGKTDEEIFSPELAAFCKRTDNETIQSGKPLRLEETSLGPDGTLIYFDTIKAPIYDKQGRCQGLVGVSRDITTRKQAEKALRESEDRFRKFADEASFEGIMFHKNHKILDVNRRLEMMFGYERDEVIGLDPIEILSPESREIARKIAREEPEKTYEALGLKKDRTTFPVEIHGRLIPFQGKAVRLVSIRDLSQQRRAEEERKRLEEAFRESQKMEAIGTLAGGIAHDFNNLLMGIQGNASLMLLDLDPNHLHFQRLKNIEEIVQSASDLTRQLLGFARGGKYEVSPTDLNRLIRTSAKMFGRTKKEIRVHEKHQQDIWTVEADRGQIEHALLNLYVNAWQAMPGGGDLYLETENVTLGEEDVKPYQATPGRYVKLSIADTGIGMNETTRRRVFDPFFTTKEMGRGAGLGLAAVYGIVRNHGGFVTLKSQKNRGSTFYIYLPVSGKPAHNNTEEECALQKGHETILLVDDEDMITEVGRQLLEALGYRVIPARSGKAAVDAFRNRQGSIHMVILDMIMPDMSGGETFDILKQIDPNVKVLLSSGYSINGEATEILNRGCNGFIQKPFNINTLSLKVREILALDQAK